MYRLQITTMANSVDYVLTDSYGWVVAKVITVSGDGKFNPTELVVTQSLMMLLPPGTNYKIEKKHYLDQ